VAARVAGIPVASHSFQAAAPWAVRWISDMRPDNDSLAYLDGQYRPLKDCLVPINLHALQYGTGCFEGIRGYWDAAAGRLNILFLREHVQRLERNARMLLMQSPSVERLCEICTEIVRRNGPRRNIYLRPMVYKDSLDLGPALHGLPDGFLCYLIPLGDYLDTERGLSVCVSSWSRLGDNQIPTRTKATGGYLNSALAKSEARLNGYDEAIFLNQRGQVCEGSAENIFLVRDGVLITPDKTADILEGITRAAIIRLAADLGYRLEERAVARTELYRADEIFLCGTGCQISWVREVDKRQVGVGAKGPITTRIQQAYEDAVYGREPSRSSWLTPVVY
jgi:branched-chain amino acid aminotransferase